MDNAGCHVTKLHQDKYFPYFKPVPFSSCSCQLSILLCLLPVDARKTVSGQLQLLD
jgi:hypothetical protein